MKKQACPIYAFLAAARGNWRNALFVECGDENCSKRPACRGFLAAFDSEGKPLLMSAEALRQASGAPVDTSECAAVMTRDAFESFFSLWLAWRTAEAGECVLLQGSNRQKKCLF